MGWIETYLNKPEIKKQLGAPSDRTFESCNMQINQAFMCVWVPSPIICFLNESLELSRFNGDVSHNTAALIPPMLEDGIRVLIYLSRHLFEALLFCLLTIFAR